MGPAERSAANSRRDRCAGSPVDPILENSAKFGRGDGAGVGGLSTATYSVGVSVCDVIAVLLPLPDVSRDKDDIARDAMSSRG